jgi:hypothetical protein
VFRKSMTALLLALLAACSAKESPAESPDAGVMPTPDLLPEVHASKTSRLKFRAGEVYAALLSGALDIPRADLCNELGLYDCVAVVHRIALFGVEPYRVQVIEPLEESVVSSPIAVERLALSACTRWAKKSDPSDRRATITTLYEKLLQRAPEERELAHLLALYESMAAIGDPALDTSWAAISCFAVATTSEALFY